jgi:hypothetical protein
MPDPEIPDNEWTRLGASGAVPVGGGSPSPAGQSWREMKIVPEDGARLMERAWKMWKRGDPVFRIMSEVRTWSCIEMYEGKVFTDITWIGDFFDPKSALYNRFRIHNEWAVQGHPGTNSELQAALCFTIFKTLEKSDSPSWFRLSDGLTWKLITTELKGVYPEDIRLPLPGFYIELPKGILTLFNNLTGEHEVRAVAVCEGAPHENERLLNVNVDVANGYGRRLLIVAHCEPNENSTDPGDDNVMYLSLPLYDTGKKIGDLIERDYSTVKEHGGDWRDAKFGGYFAGQKKTNLELRRLLQQFVMNVLLYMNSAQADIRHVNQDQIRALKKEKKGRKKHKKLIQKLKANNTWLVGTNVVFDPRVKQAAQSSTGTGSKLRFKSLVRGHWRAQAHGKGRKLRKLIWIEPHIRGGDLPGKVLGHNYEVKS